MTPERKKLMYLVGGGLLLAAIFYKPKKANASTGGSTKVIGVREGGNPPIGDVVGSNPTVDFMPTDKAMIIQKNLNEYEGDKLTTEGLFGPKSWARYQQTRPDFVRAAEYGKSHNKTNLKFFADVNIFYDPVETDKVTFRFYEPSIGSPNTITLRKSLYEKLSAGLQYVGFEPDGTYCTKDDQDSYIFS